jgi:hypothetical protein
MPTATNLVRTAGFLGLAAVIALIPAACGRKEVAARTQPPKVSKWRCHVQNGIPKGVVVEEQGGIVRAQFCDLKPGARFEIHSTLAHGTHFPERNTIVFPLGMPGSANLEQWLQSGGTHLSVSFFDSNSSRLIGVLASSSGEQSFLFVRHNP